MRVKRSRPSTAEAFPVPNTVEVRKEIDNFMHALSSYPDRFAREPHLSFEQHMVSIAHASQERNAAEQH